MRSLWPAPKTCWRNRPLLKVKAAALAIRVENEQPEMLEQVASRVSEFTAWLNEFFGLSATTKKSPPRRWLSMNQNSGAATLAMPFAFGA